jgi:hypothetical protein
MITDRPTLSLAELEMHDPNPTGHGAERRFLCPFPACADHQRREHKNLAANLESGLWECWRCGASGKLTEKWERPQPRARVMRLGPYEKARRALGLASTAAGTSGQRTGRRDVAHRAVHTPSATLAADENQRAMQTAHESTPSWRRRWERAIPVAGTPGQEYLASRGIPIDVVVAAGVRYLERWEHWTRDERGDWRLEGTSRRVVFPIVGRTGEIIGVQGRKIADSEFGSKMLTNGQGGVFMAGTAWPVEAERVAIIEAPIDALSLAAVGLPALATQGTIWPDWLPLALAFKKVLLAHDNDEPNAEGQRAGDIAAASLVPALRSYGAEPQRCPPLSKDWNQDLQDLGLNQLRRLVASEHPRETTPVDPAAESPCLRSEGNVDAASEQSVAETAYQGAGACAESIDETDRAEVVKLLEWLRSVDFPHERFQLRPWVSVVDLAQFAATLHTDLSSELIGPRWRAAAEDLKQLARMYRGVERGQPQAAARPGRAPPVSAHIDAVPACLPF